MSTFKTLLSASLLLVSGCCIWGGLIDQDVFERRTLEEKIVLYEDAIRRRCVTNDMMILLSMIARHGEPASDAMTELLREPREDFPVWHAIIAFEYTRYEGVDLRNHEGMLELRRLAENHPDELVRDWARKAIEAIERSSTPTSTASTARGGSSRPTERCIDVEQRGEIALGIYHDRYPNTILP